MFAGFSVGMRGQRLNPRVPNPDVQTKYDRFNDESIITARVGPLSTNRSSMYMVLLAAFKGQKPTSSAEMSLALMSESNEWEFLRASLTLVCILDSSERVVLGEMTRLDSKVVRGGVRENLIINLPFKTIERIANAKKVEMKVWLTEFSVSSDQQSTMRYFLEELRPVENPENGFYYIPGGTGLVRPRRAN